MVNERSYSTLGPVSAYVGDRLQTGKPLRHWARHPGLLSLSLPSVQAEMSTVRKPGIK